MLGAGEGARVFRQVRAWREWFWFHTRAAGRVMVGVALLGAVTGVTPSRGRSGGSGDPRAQPTEVRGSSASRLCPVRVLTGSGEEECRRGRSAASSALPCGCARAALSGSGRAA